MSCNGDGDCKQRKGTQQAQAPGASGAIYFGGGGIRSFMRLPVTTDPTGADFAIVGLPTDIGSVSYRSGARFGPEAVRSASTWLFPYHPELGVSTDTLNGIDYGDVHTVPGAAKETLERIEQSLGAILEAGAIPLCIGGDHSVSLAELRAAAKVHGPLAVVVLDAHPDTWPVNEEHQRYWHSSPFRQAVEEGLIDPSRSIICGVRGQYLDYADSQHAQDLGFEVVRASDMHEHGIGDLAERIRARVDDHPVFLSFDVDFLDPAYAPATGSPQVGGFSTAQAQQILRGLKGLDIRAADVVEVAPAYDHAQVTALAAANVMYEVMALVAARKQSLAN